MPISIKRFCKAHGLFGKGNNMIAMNYFHHYSQIIPFLISLLPPYHPFFKFSSSSAHSHTSLFRAHEVATLPPPPFTWGCHTVIFPTDRAHEVATLPFPLPRTWRLSLLPNKVEILQQFPFQFIHSYLHGTIPCCFAHGVATFVCTVHRTSPAPLVVENQFSVSTVPATDTLV